MEILPKPLSEYVSIMKNVYGCFCTHRTCAVEMLENVPVQWYTSSVDIHSTSIPSMDSLRACNTNTSSMNPPSIYEAKLLQLLLRAVQTRRLRFQLFPATGTSNPNSLLKTGAEPVQLHPPHLLHHPPFQDTFRQPCWAPSQRSHSFFSAQFALMVLGSLFGNLSSSHWGCDQLSGFNQ